MAKKRSPAYTWYPADYATDEVVSTFDNETYGLFRRLYDQAWLSDGLPEDPARIFLYSRCATRRKFQQLWMSIEALFPPDGTGRRRNAQQEAHRRDQRKYSKTRQLAARTRWNKVQSIRNAYALQDGDALQASSIAGAVHVECLSSALSSSTSDQTDQEDQRAVRRALPVRMALPVQAVRRHLLAACHRLLESGPPYLVDGAPVASELTAELKGIAVKLGAAWEHARELALIVDVAIAQRQQGQAVARYQAARARRDRRALRRAGGR